jgi:hypothetical protein
MPTSPVSSGLYCFQRSTGHAQPREALQAGGFEAAISNAVNASAEKDKLFSVQ